MNPNLRLEKELHETTRYAIKALPYIPKYSKYRTWVYLLLAEEIEAWKYLKLKARLRRFYGEEWV